MFRSVILILCLTLILLVAYAAQPISQLKSMPSQFLGTWYDNSGKYATISEITPTHILWSVAGADQLNGIQTYRVLGTIPSKPNEVLNVMRVDLWEKKKKQPPYIYTVGSMEIQNDDHIILRWYHTCFITDGALDSAYSLTTALDDRLYTSIINSGCLKDIHSKYVQSRRDSYAGR